MNTVKSLRKLKGLTQKGLAEQLGVCKEYISILERGKQTPGFKLANEIAHYFSTTLESLNFFGEAENKSFGGVI